MTAEVEGKTQPIEQMIPDGKKVLAYPPNISCLYGKWG